MTHGLSIGPILGCSIINRADLAAALLIGPIWLRQVFFEPNGEMTLKELDSLRRMIRNNIAHPHIAHVCCGSAAPRLHFIFRCRDDRTGRDLWLYL